MSGFDALTQAHPHQYGTQRAPAPDAQAILQAAGDDLCALAAQVGIDGRRLLGELPESGQLLTGSRVPVLNASYRGRSYALLYINTLQDGSTWPYLVLGTHRHGGVRQDFHGLRWWQEHRNHAPRPATLVVRQRPPHAQPAEQEDLAYRLRRHRRLENAFRAGRPLAPDHPWLQRRLLGYQHAGLLARLALRQAPEEPARLLAPLTHPSHGCTGFHELSTGANGDRKRHYLRRPGWLSGSAIEIGGNDGWPVALCEGLATGLSLALVWPGPIRVALCAQNLAPVRQGIQGPAVLFYDNDCWGADNTGLRLARRAARADDRLCGPTFSAPLGSSRPTDFNDLLQREGLAGLQRQLAPLQ